jgi:hypothetical protein
MYSRTADITAASDLGDGDMRKARRIRDEEVADGEVVHVGLELMDSWQRSVHDHYHRPVVINTRDHQPHYLDVRTRAVLDAKRQAIAARDSWVRAKVEAWRGSPTTTTPVGVSARDAWVQRARDAWKSPPTPVRDAEFNRVSPQEFSQALGTPNPIMQPPRPDAKEREYQARCESLQNAWRTPTGTSSPSAAAGIERQRRAVTHEDHR